MPPTEQQQAQLKAAEMLEEMIKCTHQLDEILQRLVAGDDDELAADVYVQVGQSRHRVLVQFRADSDCCVDDSAGVSRLADGEDRDLGRSGGHRQAARSLDGGGDLVLRFASCTRDTAFPSLACSDAVGGWEGRGLDGAAAGCRPPPEFNVSYSGFLSRLRQQIVACDHIVPVGRADAAAQLAFLLLEEQQRWLLGAISNHFPYRREAVYWTQGNRVCEVRSVDGAA
ncbi:E3 ubiquitin protein ligase [Phytophthora cinnamomi]|uniref:E3 ubiquitin protein ligase n=1 Tax=Phytophthora cinnamomi TaxID=4785 RepID=UPI0035596BBC|nr:E3 ubiquitin protein ligase [Phytophthora cinnamomi]